MSEIAKCQLCGEPMPPGEEVFNFHGYSGPCPKPPLLQPFQQRVVTEKQELDVKLKALDAFGRGETFKSLPPDEQYRLGKQLEAMETYSRILGERIAAFK